jgi:hypothetical protein
LVENLKINIRDILSLDNISQIKSFFEQLWLKNYYDFYYFESKEFNNLLKKNNSLRTFFNSIVWKKNIKNSYASTDNIIIFAENIWFNKLNVSQLKDKILSDINNVWIHNLNDLENYGLNKYIKTFNDNSFIKYYTSRKMSKWLTNLDLSELIKLHENLWFEYLDEKEILTKILSILNLDWINYLEDLEKIKVREFREKYITTNPNFLKYIQWIWIKIKYLTKDNLFTIGENIWLKRKKIENSNHVQIFLKSNWISSYSDLRELWINWARDLLWADDSCRKLLKWFWVDYLQDFREDHLKKFARFVWLNWICEEKESDENSIKERMILKLLNNWVDCEYSLKLFWIKAFKNLFKEKNIWNIRYNEVNNFVKLKIGVNIPLLTTNDLVIISKTLWFKLLSDLEHKEKLINFLNSKWLDLNMLNRNHVKEKYWKNSHIRYFFEKIWLTIVKDLRLEHLNQMKEYIKSI